MTAPAANNVRSPMDDDVASRERNSMRGKLPFGFWVFVLTMMSAVGYPLFNAYHHSITPKKSTPIAPILTTPVKERAAEEVAACTPTGQPVLVPNSPRNAVKQASNADLQKPGKAERGKALSNVTPANRDIWSDPRGYAGRVSSYQKQ